MAAADLPQRQESEKIGFDLNQNIDMLSLEELQVLHQKGLKIYRSRAKQKGKTSWVAIKLALAKALLEQCNFCIHDCQVNRKLNQTGYCQLDHQHHVSGEYLHYGEEAQIAPTHAIFFSGCTMHCVYCHNWRETFDRKRTMSVTPHAITQQIEVRCQNPKVKTISWIGGTPEPHLHTVLEVSHTLSDKITQPMVFNGNATLSTQGLELMEGIIDIYLPDFKHGNPKCAWQLTKIKHYVKGVKANLKAYSEQNAKVLIRHLILPGHIQCCSLPILDFLAQSHPTIPLNIMGQYRPMYQAESIPSLAHKLSKSDAQEVKSYASQLGLNLI